MRRRICFAGTAVVAASLVIGVGIASAASSTSGVKPIVLKCHIALATAPPAGSAAVAQPPSGGNQAGPIHCPTATFGPGVEWDTFTVPDTGDTVGTYVQYFDAGSIHGTFDLTPSEGSGNLTGVSFESQSWTGTVNVLGGTGVYKGTKSKKGTGTLTCTSPDSVHVTCVEKVKIIP